MAQKTLRGQFVLHTAIQGKPIISAATAEIKFGAGYSEKKYAQTIALPLNRAE